MNIAEFLLPGMNKKPSFLERLTGVLEEEEETKDIQINRPEENEAEDEEKEETEEEKRTLKTPSRPKESEAPKKKRKFLCRPIKKKKEPRKNGCRTPRGS